MVRFELDPDLVIGPLCVSGATEVLRTMADRLVQRGYVKPSYPEAVIAREREFPTGLPATGPGVAVPHCDSVHVLKPTIAVATLAHPVPFGVMGDKDATVPVDIVIMLAIDDPSTQIDILRKLALLVQNPDALRRLRSAACREEVMEVLRQELSC